MELKVSMLLALLSLGTMAACDLPDPDQRGPMGPGGPGGPGPGPGGGPDDDEPDAGPIPEPTAIDELPTPALPAQTLDYSHDLPAHFDTAFVAGADNTPGNNQISDAGATLGRVLFWDRRLSQNGAVSCGSCHEPRFAFSDDNELSRGFEGGLTVDGVAYGPRHGPSLRFFQFFGIEFRHKVFFAHLDPGVVRHDLTLNFSVDFGAFIGLTTGDWTLW